MKVYESPDTGVYRFPSPSATSTSKGLPCPLPTTPAHLPYACEGLRGQDASNIELDTPASSSVVCGEYSWPTVVVCRATHQS